MKKLMTASIVCVGLLTGCATTEKTATAPASAPVAAAEVKSMLSGNTVVGSTVEGRDFAVHYREDGSMSGQLGPTRDVGRWDVRDDGQMCSQWKAARGGARHCSVLRKDGDQIRYYDPSGRVGGQYRVLSGNPNNL